MPLLLRGTHAEETAEQRYVRAARARCPPPPPGDDLYDWRRGQEARASLLDARAAVEAYACLLDACVAAPGGVERCRLSAADGCALRAAAARAVVARGGSSLAAPGLLARPGTIVGRDPDTDASRDLALAREAVMALGRLDIGQAAVSVCGRVIAVEGAEGTDAMLKRCRSVRDGGRVKGKGGVLVKCAKPGQDMRVDLPTIGPETVRAAAKAGLSGIGIEAGRVLIAERAETEALAKALSISLWGIEPLARRDQAGEVSR